MKAKIVHTQLAPASGKTEVSTYRIMHANGSVIRKATQVRQPNGVLIRFIDHIPSKRQAILQAAALTAVADLANMETFYRKTRTPR